MGKFFLNLGKVAGNLAIAVFFKKNKKYKGAFYRLKFQLQDYFFPCLSFLLLVQKKRRKEKALKEITTSG